MLRKTWSSRLFLSLIVIVAIQVSNAFQQESATQVNAIPKLQTTVEQRNSNVGIETLRFVGFQKIYSKPFTPPEYHDSIKRYFQSHRNLLFPEHANIGNIELSQKLKDHLGDPYHKIPTEWIELDSQIGFAGLKVCSTALIACQMHDAPEYHFTMLDSQLTAKGTPPLVWLFSQLVGKNKQTLTTSSTVIRIEQTKHDMVAFTSTATIEIELSIPKRFMKIINGSKKIIEQQGSDALQGFLEKESMPGLQRFRDTYVRMAELHENTFPL